MLRSIYKKLRKPRIANSFKVEDDEQISSLPAPEKPYVFSSSICRSDHFHMPLYGFWCKKIGQRPRFHRKQWEFVYIAHALFERGYLAPGKSGIGFGVGKEPLVDLFASLGCKVTATDLSPDEAAGTGWIESSQHSSNKNDLYKGISSEKNFERLVDFRYANMNCIPRDLQNYDFCYSSCSIEHVGSLSKSLDFVMNSVELLKPGGVSIHTTELNLSSNDDTIDYDETVLWRRKDFARLSEKLLLAGHSIEPFDFFAGSGKINEYIDIAPYKSSPHLRLKLVFATSHKIPFASQACHTGTRAPRPRHPRRYLRKPVACVRLGTLGKFASTSCGVIVYKGNGTA